MRKQVCLRLFVGVMALLLLLPAASGAVDRIEATFEGAALSLTHYVPAADFVPGQPVPVAANRSDRPCRRC